MLAACRVTVTLFTPKLHLFTAIFYRTADTRCACTSVNDGPHLGSLVPRPTPAGLWGTAGPVPTRPAPSQHRTGLPGRPTRAALIHAPDGGTTEAAAWPSCALRAVASTSRAHLRCCPMRQRGRRPPARAQSDLQLPQRPDRLLRWPPEQRQAAALQRHCGGLTTWETQYARSHKSVDATRQGWGSVGPVTVRFMRISGWL